MTNIELVTMLKGVVLREAKNSFKKLNAIVIQFFGGFLSLFMFMFIIEKVSLFESILWGIIGYLVVHFIYFTFTVSVSLSVNKKIRELQDNYFLPDNFKPNDIYPHTRKLYSTERNLLFDPEKLELSVDATMTMVVQSNIDNLSFIKHSIGMGENTALRFENMELTPIYDEFKRSFGEIKFERTQDTKVSQRWRIIFVPGLKKGEEASYKVKWSYSGAKFLSFEEFSEARTRLQVPTDKEFDSLSRSTPVPCEKLISTLQFPIGYSIFNPSFSAKMGGHVIEKEIERIKSREYFKIEQPTSNRGWKLILEIEKPILSVSYVIQWKPPNLDSLVERGFINKGQKGGIIRKVKDWPPSPTASFTHTGEPCE